MTYPKWTQKMKDFVILSLIRQEVGVEEIERVTGAKGQKIEEMRNMYETGWYMNEVEPKITMIDAHKDKMKAADWAMAYGLHSKIN